MPNYMIEFAETSRRRVVKYAESELEILQSLLDPAYVEQLVDQSIEVDGGVDLESVVITENRPRRIS